MDYEKSLSRHDLLWTHTTTFLQETAFLGNGMVKTVEANKHLCNFFGQNKHWRLYGFPVEEE